MDYDDISFMAVGAKDEVGMWILAQCLTSNFCAWVSATTDKWKIIQLENGGYPKLMTRKNITDLGVAKAANNGAMVVGQERWESLKRAYGL
ncbi:hypothetical protein MTR67_042883 [Solanum verrucosum]|uniref:Uncharacterized protein n=1 Tax=Solanum verrucosum TaxID=315347 RepID=A0AAF0UQ97_SOLVR|nr:hypothetical protein MTR67_042883 [Solanum verrucosum]